jgi:hypothetical protein
VIPAWPDNRLRPPSLTTTDHNTISAGSANLYLNVSGSGFLPGAIVLGAAHHAQLPTPTRTTCRIICPVAHRPLRSHSHSHIPHDIGTRAMRTRSHPRKHPERTQITRADRRHLLIAVLRDQDRTQARLRRTSPIDLTISGSGPPAGECPNLAGINKWLPIPPKNLTLFC